MFIISCFIPNLFFSNAYVTLPFIYINKITGESSPNTQTPKDYFESLYNYTVYTTIKINNKDLNFHLTLNRYITYISEKTLKELEQSDFNNEGKLYSLEYIGIYRAKFKNNKFTFLVNNNQNIVLNNYSFFMVTEMQNASDFTIKRFAYATENEEIGLNVIKGNIYNTIYPENYDPYSDVNLLTNNRIYNSMLEKSPTLFEDYIYKDSGYYVEDETNIINQLKKKDLISSYTFSIKYDNKNEEKGSIIIGGFPHEIDKEHYNENYFIYDNVVVAPFNYNWHYSFKDISYDGEKLGRAIETKFSIEFGFIASTDNYKKYLDKKFFKNDTYIGYCSELNAGEYFVKTCQESVIKDFKPINIYLSVTHIGENQKNYIEFNYKDLFVKAPGDNNLYYFQIVFANNDYGWVFGRPLFKKYQTVFDQEKKIIGFYTETGEYKTEDNKKEEKQNNISLSWILVIILVIIIICLIIFGIVYYKKLPFFRKKKANELEDNFDYTPSSEIN